MVETKHILPGGTGFVVCDRDSFESKTPTEVFGSAVFHGLNGARRGKDDESFSAVCFEKEGYYCVSWPLILPPTNFFANVEALILKIENGVEVRQGVEEKGLEWEIFYKGKHLCNPAKRPVSYRALKRKYPGENLKSVVRFNTPYGDFIYESFGIDEISKRKKPKWAAYLVTSVNSAEFAGL